MCMSGINYEEISQELRLNYSNSLYTNVQDLMREFLSLFLTQYQFHAL